MIFDLHCDLLSFLTETPGRSVHDPLSRCSYPELIKGKVALQVLAIYDDTTSSSVKSGQAQVEMFSTLLKSPLFQQSTPLPTHPSSAISIIAAIENGSTFAKEDEPLQESLWRLERYRAQLGPIAYISLTWNHENRFGGGAHTTIGLKEDGKRLIDFLHTQQIAVDLSHSSDPLAYDIINHIDKYSLDIPLIASHSNFRAIQPASRNLSEDLAKEIIRRKGLIGLNLFAPFLHPTDPTAIIRHVEYALSLGGEDALCLGADFFHITHPATLKAQFQTDTFYFDHLNNASCYPYLLDMLHSQLGLSQPLLANLAHHNIYKFLSKLLKI